MTSQNPQELSLEEAFDPLSPRFARDPYSVYRMMRASDEPFFYAGMNAYMLARYEDVESAARNARMVRSLESFMPPEYVSEQQRLANFHDMPNHERFIQSSMLEQDGENHRRLRMLVLQAFSRTLIERHRGMIQTCIDRLLDELLEQRDIDFIADFASLVPGHIIGNILGVPDEDCPQLRVWSENIVQYFDADRTAANKQLAEDATTEFHRYLTGLIEERSRHPGDDLLSTLVTARKAGRLDETELVSISMLILAGGHGSTIDVLGTGLYALLVNPDQFSLLRRRPELIHTAVQEMFRYESPLPFFHRYASEDLEIMGRHYPAGTKFGLLYGSANRDPDQFPEADRFRIQRTPNRHVAFGRGAHLCLGNNLSRLDMEILFLSLLQRTESIHLRIDEPVYKTGLSSRGLTALPVTLNPAKR